MPNIYDQLAKRLLTEVLTDWGEVETEQEVQPDVRRVDVSFVPERATSRAREQLGLLGEMIDAPALFEPYSRPPRIRDVQHCLHKQLGWPEAAVTTELELEERHVPRLWVLSAGRPESVLEGFEMQPMSTWPSGFYRAAFALRLAVVVMPELPERRETLLLRMMGRGETLRGAVEEIIELPEGALERRIGLPLLHRLRFEIPPPDNRTPDQEEFAMEIDESFEEFRERLIREGLEEGRKKGLEEGRKEGRREQLLELASHLAEPEKLETLRDIEDLDDLQRRVLSLIDAVER